MIDISHVSAAVEAIVKQTGRCVTHSVNYHPCGMVTSQIVITGKGYGDIEHTSYAGVVGQMTLAQQHAELIDWIVENRNEKS